MLSHPIPKFGLAIPHFIQSFLIVAPGHAKKEWLCEIVYMCVCACMEKSSAQSFFHAHTHTKTISQIHSFFACIYVYSAILCLFKLLSPISDTRLSSVFSTLTTNTPFMSCIYTQGRKNKNFSLYQKQMQMIE